MRTVILPATRSQIETQLVCAESVQIKSSISDIRKDIERINKRNKSAAWRHSKATQRR